ncbi:MAG: GNAT family N-acetyltransferase [Actinobacteria bacterium]|nr:GNAT family N-acetyltransferase [Actinomycetota bacterium]MBI3687907.1 GNAT family N-acetyltransferase [Actinomycetota bacterium]
MDRFYGATELEPLECRERQVSETIFSNPPAAHALLAWDGEQLVGFATYSFLWPAVGLTRSLYLKELYVSNRARRTGVGRLLMHRLFELAVKHDCSRVEWTTDQDNVEARRFYELLGAPLNTSKLFYRLEGDGLRRAAQSKV